MNSERQAPHFSGGSGPDVEPGLTEKESNGDRSKSRGEIDAGALQRERGGIATDASDGDVVVDWEGPDDQANPMNWPEKRKLFTIVLVSANTFNVSLASTIFAPGVSKLMAEFHNTSNTLSGFVVSAYIVPFILGPLVLAPLSELYGRNVIMHTANLAFLVFTIICAVSQNMAMFVIFRLLQGLAGCVPLVIGGGTIGDLMPPEQRGKAMSGWQLGPLMVRVQYLVNTLGTLKCADSSSAFSLSAGPCTWPHHRWLRCIESWLALAILACSHIGMLIVSLATRLFFSKYTLTRHHAGCCIQHVVPLGS